LGGVCYRRPILDGVALPGRIVLFGGGGQLGTEIRRLWHADIVSPPHAELDITDAAAVEAAIEASEPDAVVNCAAFHHVERCEDEPHKAFAANALAVNAIAEACAARGVRFVTFSTDYVFDGTLGRPYTETDAPNPLNAYGVSKFAGELLVQRLQSDAFVIRTCGVYSTRTSTTKGYTFIDKIIAQARAGEPVRVVRDQVVSPTYAAHLAQAVAELLESNAAPGLYHAVNEGAVSWYDYAAEALRVAGVDYQIEPALTKDWNTRVRRPAFSALKNAKLHAIGIRIPDWRAAVADYLRDRSRTKS
jgi:dTDP-4-dehydrorhamnose reductase